MRITETPTDECINLALHPKSTPAASLHKDCHRSESRIKYVLFDMALIILLGLGCFQYYVTTFASPGGASEVPVKDYVRLTSERATQRANKLNMEIQRLNEETRIMQKENELLKVLYNALDNKLDNKVEMAEGVMPSLRPVQSQRGAKESDKLSEDALANLRVNDVASRFQGGDVVEIFDHSENHGLVLTPLKVDSANSIDGVVSYELTRAFDGSIMNVREENVRLYEPYPEGSEVLCNMGRFKEDKFLPCTVLDYKASEERGVGVLRGLYSVRVHATENSEDTSMSVPVWKMKRLLKQR